MMSASSTAPCLLEFYQFARRWVENSAYADELHWQANLNPLSFSESDFLREYAWVILNSGFRESVVRKHFNFISLCYCDWQSAKEIYELGEVCGNAAASAFAHRRKLRAITQTAGIVSQLGFDEIKKRLLVDFLGFAQTLPFIGSVTARHLAKNLGIDIAKPDRHLARLADQFGYSSVDAMCLTISLATGDRLSVTDIVLWRFQEQAKSPHAFAGAMT
jgi:hypothetical protein